MIRPSKRREIATRSAITPPITSEEPPTRPQRKASPIRQPRRHARVSHVQPTTPIRPTVRPLGERGEVARWAPTSRVGGQREYRMNTGVMGAGQPLVNLRRRSPPRPAPREGAAAD